MNLPLCVIPAAGLGTRMGGLCKDTPKALLKVNGKTLVRHVIDFWSPRCEEVVVVLPQATLAANPLPPFHLVQPTRVQCIPQLQPTGPVDAILCALEQVRCPRRFVVALGDCLCEGEFDLSSLGDEDHGVAVHRDDASELGRSYSVGVYDDVSGAQVSREVCSVIEKPALGLGYYWFSWHALPALKKCRHSTMTAVVQELVESGQAVRPVPFCGSYRNVTYPVDLDGWT